MSGCQHELPDQLCLFKIGAASLRKGNRTQGVCEYQLHLICFSSLLCFFVFFALALFCSSMLTFSNFDGAGDACFGSVLYDPVKQYILTEFLPFLLFFRPPGLWPTGPFWASLWFLVWCLISILKFDARHPKIPLRRHAPAVVNSSLSLRTIIFEGKEVGMDYDGLSISKYLSWLWQ